MLLQRSWESGRYARHRAEAGKATQVLRFRWLILGLPGPSPLLLGRDSPPPLVVGVSLISSAKRGADSKCEGCPSEPLLWGTLGHQGLQSRDQLRQSVLVGEDRIEPGFLRYPVSQVHRSAEADNLHVGKLAAQKRHRDQAVLKRHAEIEEY